MSGRRIGGGRVLGSGKGLAVPATPADRLGRASSPFAPSETSAVSRGSRDGALFSSPSSSSPLDSAQDLAANINLSTPSIHNDSSRLVCPICEEEMVTLLQLNRHIDDIHQELPEIQQDEVKTWLDKQVMKAKMFQRPLSLINQKLRGLDVFETNESPISQPASSNSGGFGATRPTEAAVIDPDEVITRKHWQRPTVHDVCTDPTCDKSLGPLNGSINCRKCGKLFCEVHTMYQMKLSRAAAHDPVRGYWARVCETCYKSRLGYNDHHGAEHDLTDRFMALRKTRIERQNLEIARLEKRLTRLTQLLADPPAEMVAAAGAGGTSTSLMSPVSAIAGGHRGLRKLIEQSVVTWEEDASVLRCPYCQQQFGSWTFRRHHCRICGRVVCADPQTGCSTEVGLSVATRRGAVSVQFPASSVAGTEKKPPQLPQTSQLTHSPASAVNMDVRMCRDCKTTIFAKRDFEAAMAHKPADQRAYETLRQFECGIRDLMPLFQRALQSLQSDGPSGAPPTHAQIQEAAKIRKRLMDSFTKYNLAAVRLRDMKTDSPTQRRLQKAVYTAASTFLHANMVPLKHVPRMLRTQKQQQQQQSSRLGPNGHRRLLSPLNGGGGGGSGGGSHMSLLRHGESVGDGDTASMAGSEVSTAVSALETEEKELQERLVVLEEQRFMVQQMIDNARGSRRFEEVGALSRNMEELDKEIERLKNLVSGVEQRWEGLYAAEAL